MADRSISLYASLFSWRKRFCFLPFADKRRREEGGFLGSEPILKQLKEGAPRKRVGLVLDTGIARPGTPTYVVILPRYQSIDWIGKVRRSAAVRKPWESLRVAPTAPF
jgi:hypothetical protein